MAKRSDYATARFQLSMLQHVQPRIFTAMTLEDDDFSHIQSFWWLIPSIICGKTLTQFVRHSEHHGEN